MSAGSVMVSTTSNHEGRAGSNPSPALQDILVRPVSSVAARKILERNHYLHSFPGCTKLCFGTFIGDRLLGAITFGSGPTNVYQMVKGSRPEDCLTLTRLWLSEALPSNSESRVIGISLRYLRKYTRLKFIATYADPAQGHAGIIYQASGWLYIGLSEATPKFDLGDGVARHSRSFSHAFGSHSMRYMRDHGLDVKVIPQSSKYRYIYFLDKSYQERLKYPPLPYPKNTGRVRGLEEVGISIFSPYTLYKNKTIDSRDE